MNCENCNKEHEGKYGSGRFCGSKCARGFSTKEKRSEINEKISQKMKGRCTSGGWTNYNRKQSASSESRRKAVQIQRKNNRKKLLFGPFEKIGCKRRRKKRIIFEQKGLCTHCGIKQIWNGKRLVFHLEHRNGRNKDNSRENLEAICPNCHSQTNTYAGKNSKGTKRSAVVQRKNNGL